MKKSIWIWHCQHYIAVFYLSEKGQTSTPQKILYQWQKFSMGVDLSYVNQVEDYGGVYKDSRKGKRFVFGIMKAHGGKYCKSQVVAHANMGKLV